MKYNAKKQAEEVYKDLFDPNDPPSKHDALQYLENKLKRTHNGGILIGVRAANSRHRKEATHDD